MYNVNVGNDKETIKVLLLLSASGEVVTPIYRYEYIPPVYPYNRLPPEIIRSVPESWVIGKSDSGWIKSETFYEYMANGLNKWLHKNNIKKPILYHVDGHKSHFPMHLCDFCENFITFAVKIFEKYENNSGWTSFTSSHRIFLIF